MLNLGQSDKGLRALQVNPFLSGGMKVLTGVHEALHVLHPQWSESEVVKMAEVYRTARSEQLRQLAKTVSQAEATARSASPRTRLQDLIPVVSRILSDQGVSPQKAQSVSQALDPHRRAFLASA